MLLDPTDPQSGVTVIPDLDIYRTANVLVAHHGDDAQVETTRRADA